MIPCVSDTRFGKEPAFMEGSAPCSAARDDRPSRPKNLDKDSYRSYRLSDPKQYSAPIPYSQTVAMHRKVTQTLCADLNKLLHFLRNVKPRTYTDNRETPLTSARPTTQLHSVRLCLELAARVLAKRVIISGLTSRQKG